jgi:hypothetical protein
MRINGGKLAAWGGFGFGSVASIAANILYTWIPHPPEGVDPKTWVAPQGWAPSLAAQIGAAAWPVALLISVEILSRVAWRPGYQWMAARYGGVGLVALGSAVISYGHLNGVLLDWGYDEIGAMVGPLVIDGLMTISGFALLSMSDHQITQKADESPDQTDTPGDNAADEAPTQPESIDEQVAAFAAELDEPVTKNLDERGLSLMWENAPLSVVPDHAPEPTPRISETKPERAAGNLAELTAKYGVDHDRVIALLADGAGRGTLVSELGLTPHAARELAAAYKGAAA